MFEDTNQTVIRLQLQYFGGEDAPAEEPLSPQESPQLQEEPAGLEEVFFQEESPADGEGPQEEKTRETTGEEPLYLKFLGRPIPLERASAQSLAQSLGVPVEQVIPILQKGLNYDHALQTARSAPEIQLLEEYAKLNGMTRQEYIHLLEQQKDRAAVNRQLESLRRQYPDAPEELLSRLAQSDADAQKRNSDQRAREQRQEADASARRPWVELFTRYPQLKADQIPPEVYTQVEQGMAPTAAWLEYQNGQLRQELAAARQNEKNRQLTIGTARDQGEPAQGDPFLDGFDSVFR